MKTHKHASIQAAQIKSGEFPDIGNQYRRLLTQASLNKLAWQVEDGRQHGSIWAYVPKIADTLIGMGLIDSRYRLTKLGQQYHSRFGRPQLQTKRHG